MVGLFSVWPTVPATCDIQMQTAGHGRLFKTTSDFIVKINFIYLSLLALYN